MTNQTDVHSLLNRAGNNLSVIDQVANHLLGTRQPLEPALQAYRVFLSRTPTSAIAAFNYAYYLSKDGQFELAIKRYSQALRAGIDGAEEVHLNIANIYMDHLQDNQRSREHLQKALDLNPDYASAYYNLGNLSEREGHREEATRCFARCLELDPANDSALARLADAHRFDDTNDALLVRLARTADSSRNSDVHFALGRIYEQLGEHELAWRYLSRANALDRPALPPYRHAPMEETFDRIISQCDSEWLDRFQGASEPSVFICGMFRTGSTLLEQILAAHPSFVAGGERQFFPRLVAREFRGYPNGLDGLTTGKTESWRQQYADETRTLFSSGVRVTDKRPDNFLCIGLIKAILPSARFIVTVRDWRDVATSVFATRLGPMQSYSTDLKDIRHYVGLQHRLVDHWQDLLGPDLLRVSYEDLITGPKETITRVLSSLDEPWDESCLSFHQLRNSVQTASVWQVREPFHARSVGRWKHFRRAFESCFGPDIDTMVTP